MDHVLDWASQFQLSRWIFLRALGLIYAIAFASLAVQMKGLVGSEGILPMEPFLKAVRKTYGKKAFWKLPTLFWWKSDDRSLIAVCWLGFAFSLGLTFAFCETFCLLLCVLLYLSLMQVGQDFLSFQWDILIIEAGFFALFLGTPLGLLMLWWLLFRLMFESGAVKLSCGDESWRKLRALDVHYLTQPLPHLLSWYAHRLPQWFQKTSVFLVFCIELGLPFLIVTPWREYAAFGFIFLMLIIMLTGNYNFFCLLTSALSLLWIDDASWRSLLPFLPSDPPQWTLSWLWIPHGIVLILALFIALPQVYQAAFPEWGEPDSVGYLQNLSRPFRILNSYGLFRNMTMSRPEIVIECSLDAKEWIPYEFRYKPGDLRKMPAFIQPHQPRLDWQMWFAALRPLAYTAWMKAFLYRLMEGNQSVLSLLKTVPFREPIYIRAILYDYRYSSFAEKKSTKQYWIREEIHTYGEISRRISP